MDNTNEVSEHTFIRNQIHHQKDNGKTEYQTLKTSIENADILLGRSSDLTRLCRAWLRLDCFSKTVANQSFFKYIKRKITPAEIQKIMQKKDWFAPPASLAGGAASLIFFENGSCFVQYSLVFVV